MSDFSTQLTRQFWDTMNARRILEFGDVAEAVLKQTTPQGEIILATLREDWGGYRDIAATQTDAPMNAWRFFVKARTELTDDLMSKVKLVVIGTRKWKVTKAEQPVSELNHWTLRGELTK